MALAIAGAVGVYLRFAIYQSFQESFYSCLAVNIVGSFLIGLCFYLKTDADWLKPVLTIGLCGALTTYSSYSLDLLTLLEKSQYFKAIGYHAAMTSFTLISVCLGYLASARIFLR